jgi:hypothetical protein
MRGASRRAVRPLARGLGLPVVEQRRGDAERRVDERDLDVAVTSAPRLTSGRAARIRSASAKCSPAAVDGCGVLCMGRTYIPVKAPVWCV